MHLRRDVLSVTFSFTINASSTLAASSVTIEYTHMGWCDVTLKRVTIGCKMNFVTVTLP